MSQTHVGRDSLFREFYIAPPPNYLFLISDVVYIDITYLNKSSLEFYIFLS